ncbi:hypothetical protein KA005_29555, partial [bacterium]|nr:hypothetical protein [bacterium]
GVGQVIGRLFNTHMDGLKLKSEAWVDIERTQELSPETYAYISDQKALDVGVGVYSEEINTQGEFNNEEYRAVAQNLRPDHLALLPGATGACSWDDGCGVRTNTKQKENEVKNLKTLSSKELLEEGIGIHLISNEAGFREIIRTIQRKLDQLDGNGRFYYLDEIFDTYIVYRVENTETQDSSYYRRSYAVQQDGTVEFTSDPVQVRKDVTFVVMESGKMKRNKFNSNNNPETNMERTKGCPTKVDALIANEATQFTAADKEWLSAMDDSQLDKLSPTETAPNVNAKKDAKETEAPKANASKESGPVELDSAKLKETVKAIFNESKDPEEFINTFMPEGIRGQMTSGLKMYNDNRSKLIEGIVANSSFEATQLQSWNDNDLQKLHESVATGGNYIANGESNVSTNAAPAEGNGMEEMMNIKEDKD